MFTGIIEALGTVEKLEKEGSNVHLTIRSGISESLKIDQSLAHNGVCLTVVKLDGEKYTVTAIEETLQKTNLNELKFGQHVNLERCMKLGDRLDGHIVQGHVDQIGIVTKIDKLEGSWKYSIEYDRSFSNITVSKGSITINGVSLTVAMLRTLQTRRRANKKL